MNQGVTFVIPAYNSGTLVVEAVHSALAQSEPPVEVIVVDDGSRDDTADLAEGAGARVIRQPNGGPASARNTGIRAATTDWIALLDADDISFPNRLAMQLPLTGEDGVAVICSRHETGTLNVSPPDPIDFGVLWTRNWIPTSTVLLRKAAWKSVGGFNEERELIGVEDYNFWLRLAHGGWRFRNLMDLLTHYRPTPQSLTAQTLRFARAELLNVRLIAAEFELGAEELLERERGLYLEYGLELFHYRNLPAAREFLREAARRGPLNAKARLRLWATWLPLSGGGSR